MPVQDAADFASYMHDWGRSFKHRGRDFLGKFTEPRRGSLGIEGTAPALLAFKADAPDLDVGETVVDQTTNTAWAIVECYGVNELGRPAWRCRLAAQTGA